MCLGVVANYLDLKLGIYLLLHSVMVPRRMRDVFSSSLALTTRIVHGRRSRVNFELNYLFFEFACIFVTDEKKKHNFVIYF